MEHAGQSRRTTTSSRLLTSFEGGYGATAVAVFGGWPDMEEQAERDGVRP